MQEFEITFLEIDVESLEKRLIEVGAKKMGEYNYRITIFDYPDLRMDKKESWLKLRTDGKDTTLSYKERLGVKSNDGSIPDEGMKEVEITVDDFSKTFELLKSIGLIIKFESEKKRIRYKKDSVVFDIDHSPQIPPYLEIESGSYESSKESAIELGLDADKGLICSPKEVYMKYGIDTQDYVSITFEKMVKKEK